MGFLKVLRLRHLAILWSSQVLSAMGDYFYCRAVDSDQGSRKCGWHCCSRGSGIEAAVWFARRRLC